MMPGFMFEKISPPVRPGPIVPAIEKSPNFTPGFISQMIGRLAERRAKRGLRKESGATSYDERPTE